MFSRVDNCSPGASCSKLMMLLVNDSLKCQMTILQIRCYLFLIISFALQRILTFFQQKITVYMYMLM